MGDRFSIEWTDATWNPLVGCSRVSPGCDHCYAVGVAHRGLSPQHRGLTIRRPGEPTDWTGEVRLVEHLLDKPRRWTKPRRIFVNSLSDLFHQEVPREVILRIFVTMALADRHTYQVLTKRPQRMARLLSDHNWQSELDERWAMRWTTEDHDGATPVRPLRNVWLGTSIESDAYTFRADHLRSTPAAVRWLSLEPLLGPLPSLDLTGIDWVVAGGESGHGARPMHPDWVRDIRDRCVAAGVPFFFKQWGQFAPWDHHPEIDWTEVNDGYGLTIWPDGRVRHSLAGAALDGSEQMVPVGKKAAGRELDGRTWDEMPAVAA